MCDAGDQASPRPSKRCLAPRGTASEITLPLLSHRTDPEPQMSTPLFSWSQMTYYLLGLSHHHSKEVKAGLVDESRNECNNSHYLCESQNESYVDALKLPEICCNFIIMSILTNLSRLRIDAYKVFSYGENMPDSCCFYKGLGNSNPMGHC
jgi:hypothetical protein